MEYDNFMIFNQCLTYLGSDKDSNIGDFLLAFHSNWKSYIVC